MINEAYQILKDFRTEHHGVNQKEFEDHPEIIKLYTDTMNEIRAFADKKVKLTYKSTSDWVSSQGETTGKIRLSGDRVLFFEGRKTSEYRYLDAGFFEGNYATIIPITIEEIR